MRRAIDQGAVAERRRVLALARANGIEYETRDGRTFTVVHLEPVAPASRARARAPVTLHSPPTLVTVVS